MKGIRTFYLLTLTQVFSLIGSRMTWIAIGIKIFTETGNSTPVIMTAFFASLPPMIAGSFAGVLIDRWNRKTVLLASDLLQGAGTIALYLSFSSGRFEIWHLYVISLVQGLLGMFQRPAMDAAITVLVPDGHRDRANALRQTTGPMAGLIAPPVTGLLFALIGVTGIMLIDLFTLTVASCALLYIHIPHPYKNAQPSEVSTLFTELKAGFQFVWKHRVLFNLMVFGAVVNALMSGPFHLMTPYVLTLTKSETTLGVLLGIMDAGMVLGGIIFGIWGSTRPRIHGVMVGLLFRAACFIFLGLVHTPISLGIILFFLLFSNTMISASFTSLLQLKTPPEMQGRIFALRGQLMHIANPISLFLTGPLVDKFLTPALETPGWQFVAPLVGSQPGSQMGLVFLITGLMVLFITLGTYTSPHIRTCEAALPDYALGFIQDGSLGSAAD